MKDREGANAAWKKERERILARGLISPTDLAIPVAETFFTAGYAAAQAERAAHVAELELLLKKAWEFPAMPAPADGDVVTYDIAEEQQSWIDEWKAMNAEIQATLEPGAGQAGGGGDDAV